MALSAFQQAFKDARASGETEFEFGGKKYNTKLKEEVKTSAKPADAKPAAPSSMQDASKMGGAAVGSKKTLPVDNSKYQFGTVPTSEQASENRQALMDKVKGFGSGVMDAISNFETPAERRSREAKEASGMKRGGSVKKMASGGSASKRADGIAQRGKTRGKMY